MEQSPINIPSNWDLVDHIKIFGKSSPYTIVDTGRTIEVDFKWGAQTYFNDKRFELKKLIFTLPQNISVREVFPMEVQFVHKNKRGQKAILAALIVEGNKNMELDKIWNFLPAN